MKEIIIDISISRRVVMTGVYFEKNHPGGISAVIQYWEKHIDGLQYYPTFKEGSGFTKILCFLNSYTRLLFKLMIDKSIEIVHVHTAADLDFWRSEKIIRLAKIFRKKVVLHSHASRFKDYYTESSEEKKQWIVKTLQKADVLIVLAKSWKEWFSSLGVDESKIVVLNNITDYPKLQKERENNNKVHLLFLGEIGPRKGVFDLIRAIKEGGDKLKQNIQLRIGGNKNEEQLLKAINEAQLNDCVQFEGFVTGDKKIEMLNWADVFILPSFNEGLPISILEAMSYQMPIISTPVGGIPEVVDSSNGFLVEPGNSDSIGKAILYYVENKAEIEKQGANSFIRASEFFPDKVMTHLKDIYVSLLTNK